MNIRVKALLFGVAMIIFSPFIFLYSVAYHHFSDKQHVFATVLEYIEAIIANVYYGLTGTENVEIFNIRWVDFWYRKGIFLSKYTTLSKQEIKEIERLLFLNYMSFEKSNKEVKFLKLGSVYNDIYRFKNDNTFEFEMIETTYKPSITGNIDNRFVERIKKWKSDRI